MASYRRKLNQKVTDKTTRNNLDEFWNINKGDSVHVPPDEAEISRTSSPSNMAEMAALIEKHT